MYRSGKKNKTIVADVVSELSCVYPPRKIEILLVKIFILVFGIFLREITQI